jgi:hypothetical protein
MPDEQSHALTCGKACRSSKTLNWCWLAIARRKNAGRAQKCFIVYEYCATGFSKRVMPLLLLAVDATSQGKQLSVRLRPDWPPMRNANSEVLLRVTTRLNLPRPLTAWNVVHLSSRLLKRHAETRCSRIYDCSGLYDRSRSGPICRCCPIRHHWASDSLSHLTTCTCLSE